jgi:hypothetical protein
VRSSDGVDEAEQPRLVAERPTVDLAATVALDETAGDDLQLEEHDPLQWFVDLFVAEYASEG